MSLPYDALGDLAVGARLMRQNTMQALQPLPNGYQLHLAVEDENWLGATPPLCLCVWPFRISSSSSPSGTGR